MVISIICTILSNDKVSIFVTYSLSLQGNRDLQIIEKILGLKWTPVRNFFNTAVTDGSNREPRQEMVTGRAGPRHVTTLCVPFLRRPVQANNSALRQTDKDLIFRSRTG